jgi:TPR repeat protein
MAFVLASQASTVFLVPWLAAAVLGVCAVSVLVVRRGSGEGWRVAAPLIVLAMALFSFPYLRGTPQTSSPVEEPRKIDGGQPVTEAPAPSPAPATETASAPPAPAPKIIWDEPGIRFYLSRLTYDPEDEAELGQVYENGVGVDQSYAEAARWYRAAAEQGDAIAQRHLAEMYYTARGVPQDFREAYKWYRKAALQGEPEAQKAMIDIFEKGKGKRRDDAEAYLWQQLWLKAEPQEAAGAENIAARLSPQEKAAADAALKDWKPDPDVATPLRARAKGGDAHAALALGLMYARGQGVPHDDAQAAELMKQAAEHGLAHAQEFLGNMYETGQGVKKDLAEAYFWYRLAAHPVEDGIDVTMADTDFSKALTDKQRADIETRVKNWHPSDTRLAHESNEE